MLSIRMTDKMTNRHNRICSPVMLYKSVYGNTWREIFPNGMFVPNKFCSEDNFCTYDILSSFLKNRQKCHIGGFFYATRIKVLGNSIKIHYQPAITTLVILFVCIELAPTADVTCVCHLDIFLSTASKLFLTLMQNSITTYLK